MPTASEATHPVPHRRCASSLGPATRLRLACCAPAAALRAAVVQQQQLLLLLL
jgi:hypothetical protein